MHLLSCLVNRGAPKAHHHRRLRRTELLRGGLQEGHQDGDQQDVIAQGWLQGALWGSRLDGENGFQGCPEGIGAGLGVDLCQAGAVGWIGEGGRFGGVGKVIAQPAQHTQGPLRRPIDELEPMGQGHLGAQGAEGPSGRKRASSRVGLGAITG